MKSDQGDFESLDEQKADAVSKLCDAKAFVLITIDPGDGEDGEDNKSCYAGGNGSAFEIVGALEVFKARIIEDFTEDG